MHSGSSTRPRQRPRRAHHALAYYRQLYDIETTSANVEADLRRARGFAVDTEALLVPGLVERRSCSTGRSTQLPSGYSSTTG